MRWSPAPLVILTAVLLALPTSGYRAASGATSSAATTATPLCNVVDGPFYKAYASARGDLVCPV